MFESSLEYFKNAGTGQQNQIQNIFEQMSWYWYCISIVENCFQYFNKISTQWDIW